MSEALTTTTTTRTNTCSQCHALAHAICIEHCQAIFCNECYTNHRFTIKKRLRILANQLKNCDIKSSSTYDEVYANFQRRSKETVERTQITVKNCIDQLQQREQMIADDIQQHQLEQQQQREQRTEYVCMKQIRCEQEFICVYS
jgi:hypothetical protein